MVAELAYWKGLLETKQYAWRHAPIKNSTFGAFQLKGNYVSI